MKKGVRVLFALVFLALFSNLVCAMTATINIPERYSQVKAGEKVYFETDIKWPENDIRKDLRIEYSITDTNNKEIAYLKVLKAIETQASFMDSINIPEITPDGMYILNLNISDYQNLTHQVSASFKVIGANKNYFNLYLIIILAIIAFIAIAILIELYVLIKKKTK